MTDLLVVVSIETMSDKDGIEYKRITVKGGDESFIQLPNGKWKAIKQLSRETVINAWPAHERQGFTFKADPAYSLEEGDETSGKIVTREVPEYEITDNVSGEVRTASRYTTAIFGDTSDQASFEAAVKVAFGRADHDLDGQGSVPSISAPQRAQTMTAPSKEEVEANAEKA